MGKGAKNLSDRENDVRMRARNCSETKTDVRKGRENCSDRKIDVGKGAKNYSRTKFDVGRGGENCSEKKIKVGCYSLLPGSISGDPEKKDQYCLNTKTGAEKGVNNRSDTQDDT